MNEIEMLIAIKQMLAEMDRKPEKIVLSRDKKSLKVTWAVQWKKKTYTISIQKETK